MIEVCDDCDIMCRCGYSGVYFYPTYSKCPSCGVTWKWIQCHYCIADELKEKENDRK